MNDNAILKTFPATRDEALTMLYLQQQDISDKTPEELVELYFKTLKSIKTKSSEINAVNRQATARYSNTYF